MESELQANIFNYLSLDSDPIYKEIEKATKENHVLISKDIVIRINIQGAYEVETEYEHERFEGIETCYKFVCDTIESNMIGGYDRI